MKNVTLSILTLLGITLSALAVTPAQAQNRDHGVNARQHTQHERIEQGIRSGQLNRNESRRLRQEQKAIRAEERAYKSDGKLTASERADLRRDQNRASRHIYSEKHDGQRRASHAVRDPGVNGRQSNQRERIAQGVRSGQLTKDEARQLVSEQRGIRQEERQYKSDGVLTRAERKDLQQDLNATSKHIYSEKHDAEVRR